MDRQRDLVLHIGLPKTATTALQRGVFMQDPGIAYLGKYGRRRERSRANRLADRLVHVLLWSSAGVWDGPGAALARELLDAAAADAPGDGPLVLSYEEILAHCFGVFRVTSGRDAGRVVGLDPDALVARLGALRAAWPGRVRVLVTLRRQDTFLASQFAQSFPELCDTEFATFERFVAGVTGDAYHRIGGPVLDYDRLLAGLADALGPDGVGALVFEDMAAAPERIAAALAEWIGVDAERARSALAQPTRKVRALDDGRSWRVQQYRGSRRLRNAATWVARRARGVPRVRRARLDDELARRILATWGESNRRAAERLGRGLAEHGYHA